MAAEDTPIPRVTSQPPSVDFIQNHLPSYHRAFENQNCRYDTVLQRFIPLPEAAKMTGRHLSTGGNSGNGQPSLSVRPPPLAVAAMGFWSKILPEAMKRLAHEKETVPEKVQKEGLNVREKGSWDEIYPLLQIARERYDGTKEGFWGKCRKGTRKVYRGAAKHTDVVRQVWKLVPDHVVVSPVKAAVEVLLDAVQVAADARGKITSAFDDENLEKTFEDIEIFLTVFEEDKNIVEAAVKLIVAILSALEDAMNFFLSHSVKRIIASLAEGKNYQKPLLDGIDEIQKKSSALIREAKRSELVGNREAMERIIKGMDQVISLELQNGERVEYVSDQVEAVEQGVVHIQTELVQFKVELLSLVEVLLTDGAEARGRNTIQEEKMKALQLDVKNLKDEQRKTNTSTTPSNPSSQHSCPEPSSHRPPQWNFVTVPIPTTWTYVPAPSPFVLPPNYHLELQAQQQISTPTISAIALCHILDIPNFDTTDIESILESIDAIPMAYRNRAKQIVVSPQFRNWATSPASRQLLVQGDPTLNMLHSASVLSLVCAMITKGMRARKEFVSLVFFCGRHTEPDEHPGGEAMIRSLATQLLQEYFSMSSFRLEDVDVDGIKEGDIEALCGVFGFLVKQLPSNMTLVCVLDGVGHFENAEYEDDLAEILEFLVGLVKDDSVAPAVKILVTSQTKTIRVHEYFQESEEDEEDSILLMQGLPPVGHDMAMFGIEDDEDDE